MAKRDVRLHPLFMLHTIRTSRHLPPPTEDPIDLLLSCHGRLRHFSELSLALATRLDIDDEQLRDACHRLLRYFRVALPLHEADEEETLAPALAMASSEQSGAIAAMRDQHHLLHEVLEALFPLWEAALRSPDAIDRAAIAPHARRLAAILDVHLALEETVIFPLAKAIPEAERRRLWVEMRARRTADVMTEMRTIVE
jgi:hemerythrin-like domain-containing protein